MSQDQNLFSLRCTFDFTSIGLSQAAHTADEEGANRLAQAKVIKGDLVGVKYGDFIVKEKDGKEVRLHTGKKTQIVGQLKKGDRVEAQVDDQNKSVTIRSLP